MPFYCGFVLALIPRSAALWNHLGLLRFKTGVNFLSDNMGMEVVSVFPYLREISDVSGIL